MAWRSRGSPLSNEARAVIDGVERRAVCGGRARLESDLHFEVDRHRAAAAVVGRLLRVIAPEGAGRGVSVAERLGAAAILVPRAMEQLFFGRAVVAGGCSSAFVKASVDAH